MFNDRCITIDYESDWGYLFVDAVFDDGLIQIDAMDILINDGHSVRDMEEDTTLSSVIMDRVDNLLTNVDAAKFALRMIHKAIAYKISTLGVIL